MESVARSVATAPSLDDVAQSPAVVDTLSEHEVSAMMVRCLGVLGTLQARVMRATIFEAASEKSRERMLTTQQVAERLQVSPSWVEKNMHALPLRRMVGGIPRWREADIHEWIRGLSHEPSRKS